MPVDAAGAAATLTYPPDHAAAAYAHPATAPDTSATQPPNSGTDSSLKTQPHEHHQQVRVYLFDPNLGQYVNILV